MRTYLAQSLCRRSFGFLPFRRSGFSWTECENKRPESVEATTIQRGIAQLLVIRHEIIYPNVRSKRKYYKRELLTEHETGAHAYERALSRRSGKYSIDNVEYGSNSCFLERGRRGMGRAAASGMRVYETVDRWHVSVRIRRADGM